MVACGQRHRRRARGSAMIPAASSGRGRRRCRRPAARAGRSRECRAAQHRVVIAGVAVAGRHLVARARAARRRGARSVRRSSRRGCRGSSSATGSGPWVHRVPESSAGASRSRSHPETTSAVPSGRETVTGSAGRAGSVSRTWTYMSSCCGVWRDPSRNRGTNVPPCAADTATTPGCGPTSPLGVGRGQEACPVAGHQRSVFELGVEVASMRVSDNDRVSPCASRAWRISSSKRNCSGPPISTCRSAAGRPQPRRPQPRRPPRPAGRAPTAGGRPSSVASSAMRRMNSKNCVACTIE